MATALMSFNQNPNLGLYAFINNKFALVGREVSKKSADEIEQLFHVPVHKINIAGTSLVGVFIVGNDEFILVPSIVLDSELRELDRLKINYKVLKTDLTCLGNNIVFTENGAIINPEFTNHDEKEIQKLLGVPVFKSMVGDTETPGSCIIIKGQTGLVHRDITTKQVKDVEYVLGIKASPTTINMGSPYVKSGMLCNNKGLAIGDSSGPAEIMNAEELLGFLE